MSYEMFKPEVWSENLQRELEGHLVLRQDCDFGYDGDAKRGEKVRILGVGRPTVGDYTGDDIGAPETVDGSYMHLEIDQAKYFNFMIDDIDKAQSIDGVMDALIKEGAVAIAKEADSFIAKIIYDAAMLPGAENVTDSTRVATSEAAKKLIDGAFEQLWTNGVQTNDTLTITVSPWFYNLFKDRLTELASNNAELIAQGAIGMYNNALVRLSNNLYNDGTDDFMIIRTNNAIAYAGQVNNTESYRPEGLFADAIKGLYTYGARVVRPQEMYIMRVHK